MKIIIMKIINEGYCSNLKQSIPIFKQNKHINRNTIYYDSNFYNLNK